jgi:hypothetical protein
VNNCRNTRNTAYNGSGGDGGGGSSSSRTASSNGLVPLGISIITTTITITNKFYKKQKASVKCRHPIFPLWDVSLPYKDYDLEGSIHDDPCSSS